MGSAKDSPTVSQFLNAANWEYQQTGLPDDLRPLMVRGEQLSFNSRRDGISAHVWQTPDGQLIVSYQGTQAISLTETALNPAFSFRQIVEDTGIAQGDITAGERDALRFATRVLTVADRMGVAHDEVFVTGHSLGGIQAEYVAQQTGLAGIAFESAGLPRSDTTVGTGRNFVNVVQYGDPVASYASDIAGEQPFAPGSFGRGPGALPHYGYVAMIGNPDAQQGLAEAAALSSLGPIGLGLTTALYGVGLAAYHVPNVQAYSLGVELTQYGASEVVGDRSGPVLDAADFTIRDLIEATDASYLRPRGEDPNVSPTEGRHAGDLAELLDSGERFAKATHFNDVAALVNALVSTEGGVNAEDVSFANTFVGQAFAGVESDVAGTLSRLLDDLLEGLGAAPVGTASLTDIGHLCPV